MKISVIFTTYNSPVWLEKVLWGFHYQTDKNFELIIADDGSTSDTKACIERFTHTSDMDIKHVWQKDEGFQKSRIMNKALVASTCDYVLFTDGDCIPRRDFVAVHKAHARPGKFLSGGYFKLPMPTSDLINQQHIASGQAFDRSWLVENGVKRNRKLGKLTTLQWKRRVLNSVTPAKPTWNGHNAFGWRDDIFAVNGFDERMQYGGQDRELGERLFNRGVRGIQIRYSAACLHLEHDHSYVTPNMIARNKAIRATTKSNKLTRTAYGIIKD